MSKSIIVFFFGALVLIFGGIVYGMIAVPIYSNLSNLSDSVEILEDEFSDIELTSYSMDDIEAVNSDVAGFNYSSYRNACEKLQEYFINLFAQASVEDASAICGEKLSLAAGFYENTIIGDFKGVKVVQVLDNSYYAIVTYERGGIPGSFLATYTLDSSGGLILNHAFSLVS